MTFDYSQYKNDGGEYFKFDEVGDQIVGVIKRAREGRTFNGDPCPELVIELEDGEEKTVTASQVLLRAALAESAPQEGDKVRIIYSGIGEAKPGKAPPKQFTVDVKKGPFALATPTVRNSEDPF